MYLYHGLRYASSNAMFYASISDSPETFSEAVQEELSSYLSSWVGLI